MRILVVEDEKDLNTIISNKLRSERYSVDSCYDGIDALDYLAVADYDCVVMDIMMPGKDGITVLEELRNSGNNVPVLLLTARDTVQDKVRGLDCGANDYLVKPFSFDELCARIRVLMRKNTGTVTNVITVGDLTMNTATKEVKRGENRIDLSLKEYALLECLMRHKGIVLSREKIENHIWDFDYEGGTNVIDVYISYLRRKIDSGYDSKLIHTVRGHGYVIREDK